MSNSPPNSAKIQRRIMSQQDLMRTRSSNLRLSHQEKEEMEFKQSELTSSNPEFHTEHLLNTIQNKTKSKNITSENIYTTANISAFASLLSLLALVLGIITIMLTHEKSLLTTMKTSYEFMKQLSDGWNKGIRELQIKTGGDNIDMTMQLSEFVQTMHALPWRQLRENMKEEQLEELFKVLADIPDKFDKVQDMAWSICVELRRLLGFTTDYCIPSKRHSPSKVIVSFKDIGNNPPNMCQQDVILMNELKGEYLEKGLTELMENWFKSSRDQIVYLQPMNHNEYEILSNHDTLKSYSSLSSKFLIEPRVFEKLIVHRTNENEAPFDLLYGTTMVLLSRGGIIYNDYNWHIDKIKILNLHTFPVNNVMYNPTQITSTDDIKIVVKSLNFRNPAIDTFSEYHIFHLKDYNHTIQHIDNLNDMIEYNYYESPFIDDGQTDKYYQREIARKNVIMMDRTNQEWKISNINNGNHCKFKSKMDSELHKKLSWHFCSDQQQTKQQQHQVPPVIFINEVYIWINQNEEATGIYKRIDNPFETGYFSPIDPNPKYIFVKQDTNNPKKLYRLYLAKHPNYQWYLESFEIDPIGISNCRLSLQRDRHNLNQDEMNSNLCQHIPPYKYWQSYDSNVINPEVIKNLRAMTVEFNYLSDRIYSIHLIYKNDKLFTSELNENAISLKSEMTIKGDDIYFNIFTKKDENNLDKHYNQITLDLKTYDAKNIKQFCDPTNDSETALPTIQLTNYQGKVEAIGGNIVDGKFIITFYSSDDCKNLFNTLKINTTPFDFKNK